ncbi:MAG: hypothetical protein H6839_14025 [Planctomycetes bacterium]|nr:hypothetical protein [Planctomycetota bacterium]
MDENDTSGYVAVGTPLIEQDAEYLAELIRKHSIPLKLEDSPSSPLADEGRSWFVMVQPKHRLWALEIRSNEFAEPAPGEKTLLPEKPGKKRGGRPWGRTAVMGVAGALMGMRVGVKLRGGGLATLAVGGAVALLAVAASLLFSGGQPKQASDDSAQEVAEDETPERKDSTTDSTEEAT